MKKKFFGTDGIRGEANTKLTADLAFALGKAAGTYLNEAGLPNVVCIGRDTRQSGTMLASALFAGFNSVGVSVVDLGVAPTPAVSFVARNRGYSLGIVVSASHNPAPDNGIKMMTSTGHKLSDEAELRVEALMEKGEFATPTGAGVGKVIADHAAVEEYLDFLESIVPERLEGLKVALDAAHGAAYECAPLILKRLGALVSVVGNEPDGVNINEEVGATVPDTIQSFTTETGSDVGVALDGDADRAIFSDDKGRLINGDRLIGIWGIHKKELGQLDPPVVVGTIMSNMGFEEYLTRSGIVLERTPVGDKYVSQRINETGAHIGGEQSGHIVFPAHGPTGDGLVTMLELLKILKVTGKKASSFYDAYEPWPQILVNISLPDKESWKEEPSIQSAIEAADKKVQGSGRLNVRASGTQPMVRVMVEANTYELRDEVATNVLDPFLAFGGKVYSKVDLTYALGD